MSKFFLIVEGIADVVFFRDYIIYLEEKLIKNEDTLKEKNNKFIRLQSESLEIKIFISGGYHQLGLISKTIEAHIDDGYKVLVIQDADNRVKDTKNGGVFLRLKYLDEIKEKYGVDFETFLFPNHKDDGDLETLLLQIAQPNKYNNFECCNTSYINCLKEFVKEKYILELQADKDYVYNYIRMYHGHKKAKERDRNYCLEYWDFDSDVMIPLKKFFEENISELQNS